MVASYYVSVFISALDLSLTFDKNLYQPRISNRYDTWAIKFLRTCLFLVNIIKKLSMTFNAQVHLLFTFVIHLLNI